jgi:BirA family biotin operon repressor/biotin-[acetyl-CoA-carboxylase] ligase
VYYTLLLKPDFAPDKASQLTVVMALAVAEGLQKVLDAGTAEKVGIKWPNDIVVDGKKVCGILTEMSAEQDYIQYVVIGVGINVFSQEFGPELVDKATDIETISGQRISRSKLLTAILTSFEELYELFLGTESLAEMKERYHKLLVNIGREVCVLDPKGEYRAVAVGITDSGELTVRMSDGKTQNVYAGEVSVRGIYGYV